MIIFVLQTNNKKRSLMQHKDNTEKWIELYYEIDNLYKSHENWKKNAALSIGVKIKKTTRNTQLSPSEVAVILVMYHTSGYKNFACYYEALCRGEGKTLFRKLPVYQSFIRYILKVFPLMMMWARLTCVQAQRTGFYIIDAKPIEVCHTKREHQHKVFNGYARKGKGSMGWFFGMKFHAVINHWGQIVNFSFTPGNVADNNHELLKTILAPFTGVCVGDRGYLTKLFESFYENSLHLMTRTRKSKKNKSETTLVPNEEAILVRKRGLIESCFNILSCVCDLEHSRHRKPINGFVHMLSAIIAYQHLPQKPHIYVANAVNYLQKSA